MWRSRTVRFVVLVALGAGLLAVLERVRPPGGELIWSALFDAGHAPLFGLLALVLLGLARVLFPAGGVARWGHYVAAFALTVMLGMLSELVQVAGPRNADIADALRDTAGAAAFLLVALSFERGLIGRRAALARGLAALLFVAAIVPTLQVVAAYRGRDAAFPRLCDFRSSWERAFVRAHGGELHWVPLPEGLGTDPDERVGRMRFVSRRFPGLHLNELHPDWTGYRSLAFTIYSGLDRPVGVTLKVDDLDHGDVGTSRYDVPLIVEPGVNEVSIPLERIRAVERGRDLDMGRMCHLLIMAVRPEKSFTLYFDAFRLEE